jgi:hypothetical protein
MSHDTELRELEKLESINQLSFTDALRLDALRVRAGIPLRVTRCPNGEICHLPHTHNSIVALDKALRRLIYRLTKGRTKHPTQYLGDIRRAIISTSGFRWGVFEDPLDSITYMLMMMGAGDWSCTEFPELPVSIGAKVILPEMIAREKGLFKILPYDIWPELKSHALAHNAPPEGKIEWVLTPSLDRIITDPWTLENWAQGVSYRRKNIR